MTNIFDDIEDGENERLQGMRPPVIPPTKPASARTAPTGVTSSRLTDNPPANGDAPVDAVQDEDDTDDTENEAEPQRMYTIPAIPQGLTAPSLEELMILVHAHTRACGFDVVKKGEKKPYTSRRDKETGKKVTKAIPGSKMYKLELWCSFGGTPANTRHLAADQRKRNRPSMKLKCPSRVMAWSVRGKADPDGPWMIKHSELSKPDLHNHPPVDPIELPNHRRRARQEEGIHATIQTLVRDKTSRPEAVQKLYEQFADGLFTERDVNNEIQKARMAAQKKQAELEGAQPAPAPIGSSTNSHHYGPGDSNADRRDCFGGPEQLEPWRACGPAQNGWYSQIAQLQHASDRNDVYERNRMASVQPYHRSYM